MLYYETNYGLDKEKAQFILGNDWESSYGFYGKLKDVRFYGN